MKIPLTKLKKGEEAKIIRLEGGYSFQRKLRVLGITEGKTVKNLTVQPFGGPIVLEVCGRQTTLGRGMAQKIIVEVIK